MAEKTATKIKKPDISKLAIIFLCVLFTYIFLANSWVCDDAYITFRVVDNLLSGHGPVWNTVERVQAFTNPLWMFLVSAFVPLFTNVYFAALAVSLLACLALLIVVCKDVRDPLRMLLFFALICSSKAFVDYTSSGLENPAGYLLLGIFFTKFLRDFNSEKTLTKGDIYFYFIISSLAFFNRMDTVLLYIAPVTYILFKGYRQFKFSVIKIFFIGTLPASLWLLFATIFYGSPLPNTYYAKVAIGMPASVVFKQGLAYIANSINFDPLTMFTITLAIALAIYKKRFFLFLTAFSAFLYVFYTVKVGGDFMSGRFLTMPFLLSALLLLALFKDKRIIYASLVLLLIYNITAPLVPIKTGPDYEQAWNWRLQNGVHDERGSYHKGTNLLFFDPFQRIRDRDWRSNGRDGLAFRAGYDKVAVPIEVGLFGYHAGPDKYIIDPFGHADALVARLPASESFYMDFYIGNARRDMPEGYIESCRQGKNLIKDPVLHDYYDRLLRIHRGNLFDWQRIVDIYEFTLGKYRSINYKPKKIRPLIVNVRPTHHRIKSHIGRRNERERTISSTGRAGFLQMGPYIPIKRGSYAVEWRGTVDGEIKGSIGFVDISSRDGRKIIARSELNRKSLSKKRGELTRLAFSLKKFTEDIEFRFYVKEGVKITITRIVLYRLSAE